MLHRNATQGNARHRKKTAAKIQKTSHSSHMVPTNAKRKPNKTHISHRLIQSDSQSGSAGSAWFALLLGRENGWRMGGFGAQTQTDGTWVGTRGTRSRSSRNSRSSATSSGGHLKHQRTSIRHIEPEFGHCCQVPSRPVTRRKIKIVAVEAKELKPLCSQIALKV